MLRLCSQLGPAPPHEAWAGLRRDGRNGDGPGAEDHRETGRTGRVGRGTLSPAASAPLEAPAASWGSLGAAGSSMAAFSPQNGTGTSPVCLPLGLRPGGPEPAPGLLLWSCASVFPLPLSLLPVPAFLLPSLSRRSTHFLWRQRQSSTGSVRSRSGWNCDRHLLLFASGSAAGLAAPARLRAAPRPPAAPLTEEITAL